MLHTKEDFAFVKKFIFEDTDRQNGFHEWILTLCPFRVILPDFPDILFIDIEDFVEGKWSSHILNDKISRSPYFFELESDAMAFKLRWI